MLENIGVNCDTNVQLERWQIKVKQGLLVLLQHGLVHFAQRAGSVAFRGDAGRALLLARVPCYLHAVKTLFGDIAELLIEELLTNGQLSMDDCVQRVLKLGLSLGNLPSFPN